MPQVPSEAYGAQWSSPKFLHSRPPETQGRVHTHRLSAFLRRRRFFEEEETENNTRLEEAVGGRGETPYFLKDSESWLSARAIPD